MAFFDEIGKKLSQTGQDMVQKTKDTTETMKLNKTITEEQKRIEMFYTQLGKAYFEAHPNNYEPALGNYFTSINDSMKLIDDCNERLKQLKGIMPCPNCGADIAVQAAFCSACGYAIPKPEPAPAPVADTVTCRKCGTVMNSTSRFCTGCGEDLMAAPAPAPAPAPAAKFCTNCGNKMTDGVAFCTNCGNKMQ